MSFGLSEAQRLSESICIRRPSQELVQELHLISDPALLQDDFAIVLPSFEIHWVRPEQSGEHVECEDLGTGKVWSADNHCALCVEIGSLQITVESSIVSSDQVLEVGLPVAPVRVVGFAQTDNLLLQGIEL